MTKSSLLASAFIAGFAMQALAQEGSTAAAPMMLDPGDETQVQEYIVGVERMARSKRIYTDVLKWKVKHEGAVDPSVAWMWGLAPKTKGTESLVGNGASKSGYVRLVYLEGVERKIARPNASWFDTGGLFNLNVLVKDLNATATALRNMGFHAFAEPEAYVYPGNVKGISAMMFGPEDMVLSFQERQSPPLSGWPEFEGATHVEVGYQIVTDIKAWNDFWTKTVGLTARDLRTRKATKPIGVNDFRLPQNTKGLDDSTQGGAYPRKGGEQLIGARQFVNATGADYSDRAHPPNLGIVGMRLVMKDVDALAERVRKAKVEIAAPMRVYTLEPYGLVKGFAVKAPGGSGLWTEFFEQGPKPLTKDEMQTLLGNGAKNKWTGFGGADCPKCTSDFNKDGSAKVSWSRGEAVGQWTLKGNAICTTWTTLRDGRESCAVYYDVGNKTYESYNMAGQPEGRNVFE
jgi:hypothetical protein